MTEIEKQIIYYYNKGYKTSDIEKLLPVRRKDITDAIKKHPEKIERETAISGNKAILLNAVERGINDIYELQKLTGLSKATIYTYTNIGRKKPHYNHGHTKEIIKELRAGVLTQSEIARKYGVTRQAVNKAKKYM